MDPFWRLRVCSVLRLLALGSVAKHLATCCHANVSHNADLSSSLLSGSLFPFFWGGAARLKWSSQKRAPFFSRVTEQLSQLLQLAIRGDAQLGDSQLLQPTLRGADLRGAQLPELSRRGLETQRAQRPRMGNQIASGLP